MSGDIFTAKMRLRTYLDLFVKGEMDSKSFCESFEQVYNLELDKSELDPVEAKAFAKLFDKVVWFSPIESERQKIPNYVGEQEIKTAAQAAYAMLVT